MADHHDDNLDIAHARGVLNEDHYGLQDIKERILEFLAVRKRRLELAAEVSQEAAQSTGIFRRSAGRSLRPGAG